VYPAPFDALPPPLSSCLQRHGIIQAILKTIVILSNSNQCWICCPNHEVATLVDLHFVVPSACRAWAIFLTGKGARANGGGAHDDCALFDIDFLEKD